MEKQKKITKRKMNELAELQLDKFIVDAKAKNKNLDAIASVKKALKEDQKHHELLLELKGLEVEKDQLVYAELQTKKAELIKKLELVEVEVKEFQKYISELQPEVDLCVTTNESQRLIQSEFLKSPEANTKEHIQTMTKECEKWLETNGYAPVLDNDIKKWEFAEQEKLQKLRL